MILRAAKKEDLYAVIPLVISAINDMALTYTGYDDYELAEKAIKDLYLAPDTRFYYGNIILLEIEGEIAGQATAYPAELVPILNKGFSSVYNPIAENRDAFLERLYNSREGYDGEYYIDSIAVAEKFKGMGYARFMLEKLSEKALISGYKAISLLVDPDNEKAKRVYENIGFVVDGDQTVLGHLYYHMLKRLQ